MLNYAWQRQTYHAKDLKCSFIDFASAVGNNADDDLLPSLWTPRLGACTSAEMSNVLDDPKLQ